ncbi:MAG: hypothetical protein IJO93_00440 [Clostridia bacterium]|nr:hypothetical protein [Clostridia bacterium]
MKKIISLIISIIMLTGFCACTNTLKTANEKPPLEAALDTFFDREADYDSTYFPAKFTQDELDNCLSNEKYGEFFDNLPTNVSNGNSDTSLGEKESILLATNIILTFDYAFRPAFNKDYNSFRERIQCIFNENYLYYGAPKDYLGCVDEYIRCYVYNLRAEMITEEIAEATVQIIDEFCPEFPEPSKENIYQLNIWQQHTIICDFLLTISESEQAKIRVKAEGEALQNWVKEAYAKES